jgi:hypothetical protein
MHIRGGFIPFAFEYTGYFTSDNELDGIENIHKA